MRKLYTPTALNKEILNLEQGALVSLCMRRANKGTIWSSIPLFSYLKANYNYNETNNAQEIFMKILDDETSNGMPPEVIEKAKQSFNERLSKIDWKILLNLKKINFILII